MPKKKSQGVSPKKMPKGPHKTAKRLATKHAMLAKKKVVNKTK